MRVFGCHLGLPKSCVDRPSLKIKACWLLHIFSFFIWVLHPLLIVLYVCGACYEYERKDGNQCCPQCKIKYKRHKGSPRVEGDDKEDDVDDLENEFDYARDTSKAKCQWQGEDVDLSSSSRHDSKPIPILPNGHISRGVSTEVMGLMLGEFVDEYTLRVVVVVFAMSQN